jgi:hypothetical protein
MVVSMVREFDEDAELSKFLAELECIPWFSKVGQALPAVTTAKQLRRWDDWPGPEEPAIFELSARLQAIYDAMAESAVRRDELSRLWDLVHQIVFRLACPAVPYDSEQDAWHGPTTAVWQAAFTAGLIAWCVRLRRPVPAELHEQWSWFVLGHWPSGYTAMLGDDQIGPLLVH